LYIFAYFSYNDDLVPSIDYENSSVDYDLEETFGFLNSEFLTLDPILESCTSSHPSIVAVDDACDSTVLVPSDSMQQGIHCLLDLTTLNDFLIGISDLFVESHLSYFVNIIDELNLLFDV
jgi:hypothetical protein